MEELSKNGLFEVGAAYSTSLAKGKRFLLRVRDQVSRDLVVELEIEPSDFYLLLASHQDVPASGTIYNSFQTFGKVRERELLKLDVEPIEDAYDKAARNEAIHRALLEHLSKHPLEEGWSVCRDGERLIGASINRFGYVFVQIQRYLDVEPEDERPMEDATFGGYK
ncbi:hypothetical protein [Microcystis phage Mvi-JY20]|uniref:Uncharacterized protein n=1 Tax=Microcystis phage Mvi-JY20 TaxID=3128146 RepID=A0AAX4QFV9_9CAUD